MTRMRRAVDDLGVPVSVPRDVTRVVSLVPSLTEAVAATAPGLLVGATDWCTHPVDLDVARVRGTKSPDVARVVELEPDVVLANFEENRLSDLDALRDAGVAVWVTRCVTLDEALASLERMVDALGLACPEWLAAARRVWAGEHTGRRRVAVVPIWRRPWMVLGSDTFAGDVLRRLGVDNAYAAHAERYPRVPLDELRATASDVVVLPDEPYAFGPTDGPECFGGHEVALVSGRHLTWYGPSLVEARSVLAEQLRAQRR